MKFPTKGTPATTGIFVATLMWFGVTMIFGSSLLPAPDEWRAPSDAPAPPGGAFAGDQDFAPSGEVVEGAPVIAEWNRVVQPDESFTMTGQRFTSFTGDDAGSDTTVWVLAASAEKAVLRQAVVWNVQDNLLTATLPQDLPHGLFFVWVENDKGVSAPIALNRATVDWIGPLGEEVAPGSSKRVFGKNLSRDHGETESFVFVRPAAGGAFVTLPVKAVEPYAVEFAVPADMAEGEYDLHVHNGHGGEYGFSNPIRLVVKKPWMRSSEEVVVRPSGADDTAAIQEALDSMGALPDGGTVRLQAGAYTLFDPVTIPAKVKLQGEGKGKTMVEAKIQRSLRFVALQDQAVDPPRWAAAFNKWVVPSMKFDDPVALGAEPVKVSYAYRFKKEQSDWFFRPIVVLEGPEKTALLLWVNQSGHILVRKDAADGTILAEAQMDPLPLDTYVDVEWTLAGNKLNARVGDRQVLDAEIDLAGFDQITGIRLMGVAHENIESELPVHFIADIQMQVGNRVVFADDFSSRDISPKWDGVEDPVTALIAGGDHVTMEGLSLRTTRRHLSLNNRNHLRVADLALVDSAHGTASGPVTIYGSHVEIADSDVGVIDPVDQHGSSDYWFHGNTIIGEVLPGFNHAGVYPNGRRGVIERNHFQNDWPEGKMTGTDTFHEDFKSLGPTPWLSRVLLVGGRAGRPRIYHHYIGHNTAKGVAWQGNVAEMILLHSLKDRWFGPVVSSDGLTLKLGLDGIIDGEVRSMVRRDVKTGGELLPETGEHGDHIMIVEGTGFGQIRRVMEHGPDTVTIDQPWRVPPDATSIAAIAPMSGNNIIYKNQLEAFAEGYELTNHSASTGVSLYGNTFGNFVEGNHSKRTRSGRTVSGEANRPSWWNEFRNEVAEGILGGNGLSMMLRHDAFSPVALGNTFKSIQVSNAGPTVISTMSWFLEPTSRPDAKPKVAVGNIFERVEGEGNASGILENDDGKYGIEGPVPIYQTLYRNNIFSLPGTEPAISLTERSGSAFVGNAFPGFVGELVVVKEEGGVRSAIMPLLRAIRLRQAESIDLPLVNSGLHELTWEIRADAPWIVVEAPLTGALAPQTEGAVTISIDPKKIPAGTKRGVITLQSAGQTISIGVYPQ